MREDIEQVNELINDSVDMKQRIESMIVHMHLIGLGPVLSRLYLWKWGLLCLMHHALLQ